MLGRTDIITILSLPTQDPGLYLHLFSSSFHSSEFCSSCHTDLVLIYLNLYFSISFFRANVNGKLAKRTTVCRVLVMWWRGVRERTCSIVLWLYISLLGTLCLWTVNFTGVSTFFSLLRWDSMARVGWSWVFPFAQLVRLW